MPQLMPIYWIFSSMMILLVLIVVIMNYFSMNENLNYIFMNKKTNNNWKW